MSMTIDGTAGLTFPNGSGQNVGGVAAGVQSWVDLTTSRAMGTTYTNDTGRPIIVAIGLNGNGSPCWVYVNNVKVPLCAGYSNCGMSGNCIVPNGATYRAVSEGSAGMNSWCELR